MPALAAAVEAAGGQVIAEAEVDGRRSSTAVALPACVTADGREHRAEHVVLATGAWSGAAPLAAAAGAPPGAAGQGPDPHPRGTRTRAGLRADRRHRAGLPGARARDGRLVVGATVEERGFDTRVTAGGVHELLREAYRALPRRRRARARRGPRRAAARRRPDNAAADRPGALDGLVLATGHYRNGILLTPLTAEAVAALLAGPAAPAELAHPGRFAGEAPRPGRSADDRRGAAMIDRAERAARRAADGRDGRRRRRADRRGAVGEPRRRGRGGRRGGSHGRSGRRRSCESDQSVEVVRAVQGG